VPYNTYKLQKEKKNVFEHLYLGKVRCIDGFDRALEFGVVDGALVNEEEKGEFFHIEIGVGEERRSLELERRACVLEWQELASDVAAVERPDDVDL